MPDLPRSRSPILLVDSIINFALGVLLLLFPRPVIEAVGIPGAENRFYPNILGAVLFGIGIALLLEWQHKQEGTSGLGLAGAIAINLCGAVVLAMWLLFGTLDLPLRGYVVLWVLAILLIGISTAEVRRARRSDIG